MIALPMQTARTMHTITSSRSPYGFCCFNAGLTSNDSSCEQGINHPGKKIVPRYDRLTVPLLEPEPSPARAPWYLPLVSGRQLRVSRSRLASVLSRRSRKTACPYESSIGPHGSQTNPHGLVQASSAAVPTSRQSISTVQDQTDVLFQPVPFVARP